MGFRCKERAACLVPNCGLALDRCSGRHGGEGSIEESEIFILRRGFLGSAVVWERRFSHGAEGKRGTMCSVAQHFLFFL